jgi:pimeloyl-ACP methyl ester carboxylesterase
METSNAHGLHYTLRGHGQPVVLLHGWCLSAQMWMYQEEMLAQSCQVVSPDLRGFGRSRGLPGPYTLEVIADDVATLLDELDIEDVVVVGFAFGAAVALELSAAKPQRLRELVLIGVPSHTYSPYARMPKAMRRDWPEFARRSAHAICKQPLTEATFDWLEHIFRGTPLPVALATVEVLAKFDPLELAPRVGTRAVFVHGAEDDVVPLSVSEACARLIPGARVEVVPASGHLVPIDQSEALTEIITSVRRS